MLETLKISNQASKNWIYAVSRSTSVKKPKSAYETVRKPIDKEATIAALPKNYW